MIEVLYEDEHLVFVNKPSGLAVHRGWAGDRVNAMTLARERTGRWVYPVHRLDRGTSGVLALALDSETAARVQDALKSGAVVKRYLALVRGVPPESLRIDHPIPRKPGGPRVDAVTEIRRLAIALDRYAWIEASPKTGRLHQIRRHMKHLSHPVIGDTRYGDGKENRKLRDAYGLTRLALHARALALAHPHTGEPLALAAPIPDDLRLPLARMGLNVE